MQTNKPYFNLIDSLRAFACLSVVLFHGSLEKFCREHHLGLPFAKGYLGVDLFFVLSGFLITNVLLREYSQTGKVRIKNFYIRRFLRLYPPIIIAILIFIVPLAFVNFREAFSNFFFLATYTGDVVMIFRHFIPYLEYPVYFSHCWSLAIEEQFYLFYPVLFLVMMKFIYRKKINLLIWFLIFNLGFISVIVVGTILLKGYYYKFFLWRFLQIFMGVFLALLTNAAVKQQLGVETNRRIDSFLKLLSSPVTLILTVVFILLLMLDLVPHGYNMLFYGFTLASVVLIYNGAFEKNKILNSILALKPLRYLGRISYGIYLYHFPVFYCTTYFENGFTPTNVYEAVLNDIIKIAISIILSVLSYELVEKKALKLRLRFEA